VQACTEYGPWAKQPYTPEFSTLCKDVPVMIGSTFNELERTFYADRMSELWVNFARAGLPSAKGVPEWTPYTHGNRMTLIPGDSHLGRLSSWATLILGDSHPGRQHRSAQSLQRGPAGHTLF